MGQLADMGVIRPEKTKAVTKIGQLSEVLGKPRILSIDLHRSIILRYAEIGGPTDAAHSPMTTSRYRIIEKLGAGGMGVGYKAEDTRLGRLVALKFLPPEGRQDAHAQARFEREAQAASALNHHNICAVYDIGEQDGQTFIAMELLEGVTLQEKIGSRPVPLPALLDYAAQAVAALEVAHEHGIVHRDVKPSNIFITSRGEVKLADFGLAKRVMLNGAPNGEAQTVSGLITKRGAIVGTVAYMSPEQAQDRDVDARSDIFCLVLCSTRWPPGSEHSLGNLPSQSLPRFCTKNQNRFAS